MSKPIFWFSNVLKFIEVIFQEGPHSHEMHMVIPFRGKVQFYPLENQQV